MKIVGFHSGHDSAYSILEDGIPIVHNESERFNRRKNSVDNSMQFFLDNEKDFSDVKYITTHRTGGMNKNNFMDSLNECENIAKENGGGLYIIGHHQSHAANAFFTSDFEEALIFTVDGGGIDNLDGSTHKKNQIAQAKDGFITCTTFWSGKDNKIEPLEMISRGEINIGYYWAICTARIFGLGTWRDPRGDQAGTVMGMAALGKPKYMEYFSNLSNLKSGKGWGPTDMDYLVSEAKKSEQNKFNIAASLQLATENLIKDLLTPYIEKYKPNNLCLSGGVALNCVSVGKMLDWFPNINIYVDPIPYDAGLSLGSSRYLYHQILGNPRIYNSQQNKTPYLGYTYSLSDVEEALDERKDEIETIGADDDYVVHNLMRKQIISVFGGGSESGRRALGNRSILADPRHADVKDIVNEKVKHRQWFRPFAPSVLRDYVKDWFVHDVESPYMNLAMNFLDGKSDEVPAVVHFDDTARLQTVTREENQWYYDFIDKFRQKTGVPIVLNTSFNDREPIVETPQHALDCFLRTNIDCLYFRDYGILVSKK